MLENLDFQRFLGPLHYIQAQFTAYANIQLLIKI